MAGIPSLTAEARQRLDELREALERLQKAVTAQEDREAVQDAVCWLDATETALMDVGKGPLVV